VGEIRRALSGMRHDASEGHRLLSEAYQRDPDSLEPIQALSAFSRSHREAWGELREKLPVQLGDVSDQVSSVFDAIEQDVAPLRSLLPEPPSRSGDGNRQGASESASSGSSATDRSARPSDSGRGSTDKGSAGTGSPSHSAGSDKDGLLGGSTGGLLDPPQQSSDASTSPSAEGNTPVPEPDVTLPPLLPDLLPELGIDSENAG
jgi:hypothetical protein